MHIGISTFLALQFLESKESTEKNAPKYKRSNYLFR